MVKLAPGPLGEGELELNTSVMFRIAVKGTKPAKTTAVGQRRSSNVSSKSRACGFLALGDRSFLDTNFEKLRMDCLSPLLRWAIAPATRRRHPNKGLSSDSETFQHGE